MTLNTLQRYAKGKILDVGGGPGTYLEPLTRLGYEAWLCDLSGENVRRAHQKAKALGLPRERVRRANATNLGAYPARSFDAALVAGPFYHLVDPAAQKQVLDEVLRILRPGEPDRQYNPDAVLTGQFGLGCFVLFVAFLLLTVAVWWFWMQSR